MIAAAYLLMAPPSADLAAALYRSELLARHGFTLWDGQWYAGHHTPAYSVLFPPLAWLVGVRVLAALSVIAAAGLFAVLLDRHVDSPSALGPVWFGGGVAVDLLTGRVAFLLGVALGLAALLRAGRARSWSAGALALLSALASPVAGAFVVLAGAVGVMTGPRRAVAGALVAGALTPIALLELAFPEGGREPFAASSFWPALVTLLVMAAAIPATHRRLRVGTVLYALVCVVAFVGHSPAGGNVVRLVALTAGPVAAATLIAARPRLLVALALPLAYLQLQAPVRDLLVSAADPSVSAAYYRPVLAYLNGRPGPPFRVEVPFTRSHWEAYRLAPRLPLARGWERQLDIARNPLFYRRHLAVSDYRSWLDANAVAYVALPDVALDASARAEASLLLRGTPDLRPVWSSAHWRVYAVAHPAPVVQGPATLRRLGVDGFTLAVGVAAPIRVSERFTPYWAVVGGRGCVQAAPGGFTTVRPAAPGELRVAIRFAPGRVLDHGPRCR